MITNLALASIIQIEKEIELLSGKAEEPISTPEDRYSPEQINWFSVIILQKFLETKNQLAETEQELKVASAEEAGDFLAQSAKNEAISNINSQALHLKKFMQKLEESWLFCVSGNYGICTQSRKPINYKRLIAVPVAKQEIAAVA